MNGVGPVDYCLGCGNLISGYEQISWKEEVFSCRHCGRDWKKTTRITLLPGWTLPDEAGPYCPFPPSPKSREGIEILPPVASQ